MEKKSADFNLLTRQDVNIVVKNSLGSAAKLIDYDVTNFSNRIIGFMGAHQRLSVKVHEGNGTSEATHTYFVKCLPMSNKIQLNALQDSHFFYKETNFYNYILPELKGSINIDSWCPQCYLVKDGLMVFENLATRKFSVKDRLLDTASLKSALVAMARLHASTLLAEKRLGKTFLELYPKVLAEAMFRHENYTEQWYRTGVDVVIAVAKKLGLDTVLIPTVCDRIFEAVSTSKTRQNVIGHGDTWSFNFMFDDSPVAPKCIILDFQTVRYAPTMVDVAQFLYLTMRREFREKNEQLLLREYYDEFAKILKSNKEVVVPSFSQILEEFEFFRIAGVVTAVLHLPVTMVDGEAAANLLSDVDGFARLIFNDRVDLVLDIMKRDALYNDRIVENVKELVERYIL